MAQKDRSFMVNPTYRALIGFPTVELAFIELKGRPVWIAEKKKTWGESRSGSFVHRRSLSSPRQFGISDETLLKHKFKIIIDCFPGSSPTAPVRGFHQMRLSNMSTSGSLLSPLTPRCSPPGRLRASSRGWSEAPVLVHPREAWATVTW